MEKVQTLLFKYKVNKNFQLMKLMDLNKILVKIKFKKIVKIF
jgi:hypothetical protein